MPPEFSFTIRDLPGVHIVLDCPHCGGVLLGPWEDHELGCPAASTEHFACRDCGRAMDEFATEALKDTSR